MLAHARHYIQQGYPVVAVTGKRPVVPWLAYCGRMPGEAELVKMFARPEVSGLALVIGPALWQRYPQLWVLDIEARHRAAAEAWLDARLPAWRQGRVVESGSGGLHLHLLASAPPKSRPCRFGDVKGERSVVVLPPSQHAKGTYRWLSAGPPQPFAPDAVPAPAPGHAATGSAPAYAALATATPIPEGQRHQVLTSLGGVLRRAGFAAPDLAATLQAVNQLRCQPPLSAAEVAQIADSLARYPAPNPPPSPATWPAGPAFAFLGPAELCAQSPAEVPWLWQPYLARGAVTVLAGREKVGKSTLLWALIAALLHGEPFCDRPVTRTPVVVLTEETGLSLAQKLARLGLDGAAPLAVRPRSGLTTRPRWEEAVRTAGLEAERLGAGLVVVDTLSWWASLAPEAENDAGAMTAALRPLLELSQRGPAVLAVHHLTKGSGELRGSTAIGAAADIILKLARDPSAPHRRLVDAVGRFTDIAPEPLVLELSDGRYRLVGTRPPTGAAQGAVDQLLRLLPPAGTTAGLTHRALLDAVDLDPPLLRSLLHRLVRDGRAVRVGTGTRGDPYRYTLASPPAASSPAPPNLFSIARAPPASAMACE